MMTHSYVRIFVTLTYGAKRTFIDSLSEVHYKTVGGVYDKITPQLIRR